METFCQKMQTTLIANPHSSSSTLPNAAHQIIESTRLKVLDFLKADPEHFEVVFVANATAGIKLVTEAFSGYEHGFDYYYHRDCHTSLIGVRELAKTSHCLETDLDVENWIAEDVCDKDMQDRPLRLFSYPGQSNMNGRRLPLAWPALLRCTKKTPATYTLFDIAALASTGTVDLSNHTTAPDFLVMSFYKIFGFPDLGALIIRKEAGHVFDHRKYFGGGTTGMITCRSMTWVVRRDTSLTERLEDGTGPTHNILALSCAIDTHNQLYGGQDMVSRHTSFLASRLYEGLERLKYKDGTPLVRIYKDPTSLHGDPRTQGATVAFNVQKPNGETYSSTNVGAIAADHRILLRAGGMCNPVGMAQAVGLSDNDIQTAYHSGFRCNQPDDIYEGKPFGMVRASLGPMSTLSDVRTFLRFMEGYFIHGKTDPVPTVNGSVDNRLGFNDLRKRLSSMALGNMRSGNVDATRVSTSPPVARDSAVYVDEDKGRRSPDPSQPVGKNRPQRSHWWYRPAFCSGREQSRPDENPDQVPPAKENKSSKDTPTQHESSQPQPGGSIMRHV
jgi:molybdenum cofactor sulfurtransferase